MPAPGTTEPSPPAPAPGPRQRLLALSSGTTFRSLRHRNYRLFFCGQIVSLTGSWMQTTALMWLAFQLTHQSRWPALVMAAQVLPTFFFGAWAGTLADRWPKRPLLILTQAALLVLALVLAGLVIGGSINPWLLLALTLASGLVTAVDVPARLAFVMDLVGREDLTNAVALNSLQFNAARILGPAVAGLLLGWLGPGPCFLVNGLSYLAVLAALALMDVTGAARQGAQPPTGAGHALLGGFAYLASKPALASLVVLAGTLAFCGWPLFALLPALADGVLTLGEGGYSLMMSATGCGALTAALTVATYGSPAARRTFLALGVCTVSAGLLGLSLVGSLLLACVCCAVIGLGMILFLATSQSTVQLSADDGNRGRIMGIWAMVLSGAVPLGNLLAGLAADQWGVPAVLRVQGASCAVAALYVLVLLRTGGPENEAGNG